MPDLKLAEEFFGTVRARFFHLTGLAAVPFRGAPGFRRMVAALDAFDRALFRLAPPTRKLAWQVAIELTQPRPGLDAARESPASGARQN